jgi:hypothetical protein
MTMQKNAFPAVILRLQGKWRAIAAYGTLPLRTHYLAKI